MPDVKDVCKSIQGVAKEATCEIPKGAKAFDDCKAIGGEEKNGKCIISMDRLKKLTQK